MQWEDSDDYLRTSEHGVAGLALWVGERPVGVPLLLKAAAGDPVWFARLQVVVAALCWAALVVEVARSTASPWARRVAVTGVLGLALSVPMTMWDRSVLSESLALSLTVLVVAQMLRLHRLQTRAAATALIAAVAAWCLVRDAHAVVALSAAVACGGWWAFRRQRPSRLAAGCVVAVGALAVPVLLASQHGGRSEYPVRNVYQVRVLPYPDRVEWFARHGMPQADVFLDGRRAPVAAPGRAPVVYAAADDPLLEEWSRWVERHGRATYLRWMIAHPLYVVTEPAKSPERAFNNAGGDRSYYAPADLKVVPLPTDLLLPSRRWAAAVAATIVVGSLVAGATRSALLVVGVVVIVLAVPHAAVAWHADGMETARHLTVPAAQVHLGSALLVAHVLASAPSRRASSPARASEWDHEPPESRSSRSPSGRGARMGAGQRQASP